MNIFLKQAFFVALSIALTLCTAGCKSNPNTDNANSSNPPQDQQQAQTADTSATNDPANVNVVPVSNSTTSGPTPTDATQAPASGAGAEAMGGTAESYQAPTANSVTGAYPDYQYNADNGYGQTPETYAQEAPPALPTYE